MWMFHSKCMKIKVALECLNTFSVSQLATVKNEKEKKTVLTGKSPTQPYTALHGKKICLRSKFEKNTMSVSHILWKHPYMTLRVRRVSLSRRRQTGCVLYWKMDAVP